MRSKTYRPGALVILFAVLAAAGSASAEDKRPNILFIFTDDHAFQAIGAYGGWLADHAPTPNIDQLARGGIRFDRCYVTNSICGPTRAVIQTGKHSHLNGFLVNGNKFDGTQQTFPKLLQKAGYQTAVIGKWHLGEHMAPQGYDYSEVLIGQGPYYNPTMLRDHDGSGRQVRITHTGYTTDIVTDLALDWLKSGRESDRPFLLMYQHKAPHRNWEPGPNHLDMYDDVALPEPPTLFDDYSGRGAPAKTQDMTIARTMNDRDLKLEPPRGFTSGQLERWNAAYGPKNEAFRRADLSGPELVRWKYQRYLKDYLRCVAAVDDNVGRVLQYLRAEGLEDNTIVIYCSDQGFYLGEHGWFDKRWMYEESLRTPLIVKWPGAVKAGSVSQAIVSPLDFAQTFLEVAGVDAPGDMQGRSLVPVLHGRTPADWRESFYYHYYEFPGWHDVRRHYGVTNGRYKLIRFYEPDVDDWELYDLQVDPLELNSVYGRPETAAVQEQLKKELRRLRELYRVPEQDPDASRRGGRDNPDSRVIRKRKDSGS